MRKVVLSLLAATAIATAVPAVAQVTIGAGEDGVQVQLGHRDHDNWRHDRVMRDRADCREVVVRDHLPDGTTIVRKKSRC